LVAVVVGDIMEVVAVVVEAVTERMRVVKGESAV
jgi:hypothetical protein